MRSWQKKALESELDRLSGKKPVTHTLGIVVALIVLIFLTIIFLYISRTKVSPQEHRKDVPYASIKQVYNHRDPQSKDVKKELLRTGDDLRKAGMLPSAQNTQSTVLDEM